MSFHASTKKLHQILNINQIDKIHQLFSQSHQQNFSEFEFRTILFTNFYLSYSKEEFHKIFQQINQSGSGYCDWNEFVNYLCYSFRCDGETDENSDLTLPINKPPCKIASHHPFPIIGIKYCPVVTPNGATLEKNGTFLTAGKDGTINLWSSDFSLKRSSQAPNPTLKIAKTWIVDFVAMPDVQIVCTASTEGDLRFYDLLTDSFQLRLQITNFPSAVNRMDYWFHSVKESEQSTASRKRSKLFLGDADGSVFIIEFNPEHRGPFGLQNDSLVRLKWKDFLNSKTDAWKIQQLHELLKTAVSQVTYHSEINSVFASAECETSETKQPPPGLVVLNLGIQKTKTVIQMVGGARCFAINNGKKFTVATGGADCIVRLWHISIPEKPIATFDGHRSGIVYVFVQDEDKKVYSIDRQRCVKVWDCKSETLLQSYDMFVSVMLSTPIVAFYHGQSRRLMVANISLAYCVCCSLLDLNIIDGYTHSQAVSAVLYNRLFDSVASCGLDGGTSIWNPRTGKLIRRIRDELIGKEIDNESCKGIRTAYLSPSNQFLVTGVNDGSVKTWNLIEGTCVQEVNIEPNTSIEAVFWLNERILAFGSNSFAMEFFIDINDDRKSFHKHQIYHDDIIKLCAFDFVRSFAIVCDKSELTIWDVNQNGKPSVFSQISSFPLPAQAKCMIFLINQAIQSDIGRLYVSLANGLIQVYSQDNYLDAFNAMHLPEDCVTSMATDEAHCYLFTGTDSGYLKTWLITNFCVKNSDIAHVNWPKLRLEFPFLLKEVEGLAKRSARSFENPLLVNSYRAHTETVNSVVYIDESKMVITGSADFTVRMWTLSGRYIRTFGSPTHLEIPAKWEEPADFSLKLPPDIERIASKTTLKVLNGAKHSEAFVERLKKRNERLEVKRMVNDVSDLHTYGRELSEFTLNRATSLLSHDPVGAKLVLKMRNTKITPVYQHLKVYQIDAITMPERPAALDNLKKDMKIATASNQLK